MILDIRFTKFPFIFWTSTRAIKSEVEFEDNTVGSLTTENGRYRIQAMNWLIFFFAKYAPIMLFMFIFYNQYDLSMDTTKLISYIFAVSFFIPLILFDDILRRYILLALMFVAFITGFIVGDSSLGAFALKYFIFLFCVFIFVVDLKSKPFTLFKDGKIYAHFLLPKELLKDYK